MTLNGVMAVILSYFPEFGSFRGALRKSGWRCRRKKSLRSLSSPDEFLVSIYEHLLSQEQYQHRRVSSQSKNQYWWMTCNCSHIFHGSWSNRCREIAIFDFQGSGCPPSWTFKNRKFQRHVGRLEWIRVTSPSFAAIGETVFLGHIHTVSTKKRPPLSMLKNFQN